MSLNFESFSILVPMW